MTDKINDPFAAREAEKYENPIPSREFIVSHLKMHGVPLNLIELAEGLNLPEEQYEPLRRRVKAMVRDGQLEKLRKRKYWIVSKKILITGTVKIEKGKYWVVPSDSGPNIEITNFNNMPIYSGVKVVVSIPAEIEEAVGNQGRVVEILEEKPKVVSGRFAMDAGFGYVIPHSKEIAYDIVIPPQKFMDAKDGDIVVVSLISSASKFDEPVGEVIEVLGSENTKGIEIKAAVRGFNLPYEWPAELDLEVQGLTETVSVAAKKGRKDIRHLPLVTIDGEDARDFDDAVYCEATKAGGFRLYVAIADVSYYVKENSNLDIEAKNRGNSVYFPGTVIPMLPEILSNGLCSLKPEVDRLCMVCEMSISNTGKVTKFEFYEAVMKSNARLTYTQVFKILNDQSHKLKEKYQPLLPHLYNLQNLYKILRKAREERGAIDFETIETKIIFNKSGKISKVEPVTRNIAHKIIEECMLAANVATAKFLKKHKIPGLYRVHEGPTEEKLTDLRTFLFELGIKHNFGKEVQPIDYCKILSKIRTRSDANIIQMVLLRSLSQAVYSPDNLGHFGLAFPEYTHFTSPIRRYPDLIVHRQIKAILQTKWPFKIRDKEKIAKMYQKLQDVSQHCSITERRADDATRDVTRWLKCQYMEQHIGANFNGVISGVTRFGFFVELTDIYVDGLVHVSSLRDDYYNYDSVHHKLVGERSNKQYKLGMQVAVTVSTVNVDERKIDFDLQEEAKPMPSKKAQKQLQKNKDFKKKKKR